MTKRNTTARPATKSSKTKTLKQITSDYLKENKDATISDVLFACTEKQWGKD
jgi:hypothetical protein